MRSWFSLVPFHEERDQVTILECAELAVSDNILMILWACQSQLMSPMCTSGVDCVGYADRNYRLSHDCHVIIQLAFFIWYVQWSPFNADMIVMWSFSMWSPSYAELFLCWHVHTSRCRCESSNSTCVLLVRIYSKCITTCVHVFDGV